MFLFYLGRGIQKNMHNISFSGGMTTWHMHLIYSANPEKAAQKLKKDNIAADFNGSKTAAITVLHSVDIFKKLGKNLPPTVEVFPFSSFKDYAGFCSLYNHLSKDNGHKSRQFGVNINQNIFCRDIPLLYDIRCDCLGKFFSSKHFLHIPIHEFIHSSFGQNMLKLCEANHIDFNKMHDQIQTWNLSPFAKELKVKIGKLSAQNPIEMHAEYWTKKICESLDKKLQPQYNPLEDNQIELSPLLKDFIEKFSALDFRAAKRILNKATIEHME